MPERDWSLATAFGVIAVVCFGFVIGLWAGADNQYTREQDQQTASQPNGGTLDADAFWEGRRGTAESYEAVCDRPIDGSQADLCQQWRSAQAASEAAGYAFFSLFLSAGALIGLFWTVILSNKATAAATEATRAAIKNNEITTQIGEAESRAYVVASGCQMNSVIVGGRPYAFVTFKNSGVTPAMRVTVRGSIIVGPYPQPKLYSQPLTSIDRHTASLAGGAADPATTTVRRFIPLTHEEMEAIKAKIEAIYIYVVIEYFDVFGKFNRTRATFICTEPSDSQARRGMYGNSAEWGIEPTDERVPLEELGSN